MKMIPSFIDEDSPPGERILFTRLQNSTKNWVAIHSLDLSPDNNNRRTEIDFVLLIPERGVFCIEVKSQKNIYFDGNMWQPESIRKSPFKQALDARFAFRRRLETKMRGCYNHVPVMHFCIFPCSDFSVGNNVSIQHWEFMDRKRMEQCRTSDDFCNVIAHSFLMSIENDPQISRLSNPLTDDQIEEIIMFCYPIRKRKPEKHQEIERQQVELESKLRLQQKPVIKLCELNQRVLVEGGAGTGKSLIGIEIAKRKAESGLRVAYLCFNRLIGKWAEKEIEKLELPNLVAGNVHSILLKLADIKPPEKSDSTWWNHDALSFVEEKLTDPELESVIAYDYVVIDEAQDILAKTPLWECIKLLIGGGIKHGSYLVLGDFENQALTHNQLELNINANELINSSTHWLLDENCRNYRSIGLVALTLSACDKNIWSGFMRQGGSLDDWSLHPYSNELEQANNIIECIQHARMDGFRDSEITLLSFCAVDRSVIKTLVGKGIVLEKAEELDSQHIRYATINAFKGMENKVIIITDVVISLQSRELDRRIFYTGMTRATEKLHIFCKTTSITALQNWALEQD